METARGPGWRIAIDRGGTFTDVVAWDPGRPPAFLQGAVAGLAGCDGPRGARHREAAAQRPSRADPGANPVDARAGCRRHRLGARRLNGGDQCAARAQRRADAAGDDARSRRRVAHRLSAAARHLCTRDPPAGTAVRPRGRSRSSAIDVHGNVLQPLDEPALERALSAARREGLNSVAICVPARLPASAPRAHGRRARTPRGLCRGRDVARNRRGAGVHRAWRHGRRRRLPVARCSCATWPACAPTSSAAESVHR